jgi:hypothetical protein
LEQLAGQVGPSALACALQYVSSKLGLDAKAAPAPVKADYALRSQRARDFIASHGWTFAQAAPQ